MSYSFSVCGISNADALAKVAMQLKSVVESQPVHAADVAQVQAAADAFVGLLLVDETKDVCVSVNGSVWSTPTGLQQVGVGVSASLADKAAI